MSQDLPVPLPDFPELPDIVRRRQDAGLNAQVLCYAESYARACVAPLQKRADALEASLKELVYLKRLKDWMNVPGSAYEAFDGRVFEAGEAQAVYNRRQPIAWAKARALVNPTGEGNHGQP